MKLSIFPYVVQKEILENLKISDLLLLSFVSKNMKKLIKSSQKARFKRISHIMHVVSSPTERRAYIPNFPNSDTIMKFPVRRDDKKNDYFPLNVSGKMIEFRLSDQYPPDCPEASFSPCDKESAMESIHNYFLDFFGDTVEHQYVENYKGFIPHLPKLSLCILFSPLKPERIGDIENTEHFLASSPVLKHISMSVAAPKLFSPESKFWQAESVTLTLYSNTVPTFLRHFQGRQAFATCYKWQDLDLIAFVNRWKSGKGSRKLETLNLQLISNDIPLNEFLNALGVKRIDESKTPPTHTLPVMFNLLDTVPIISHSYVVRKTDNRVASVLIRNESFSFGVWKETEEEFLRMVK